MPPELTVFNCYQPDCTLADATPKQYTELARTRILTDRCWTVLVLLNGRIYARGDLASFKLS